MSVIEDKAKWHSRRNQGGIRGLPIVWQTACQRRAHLFSHEFKPIICRTVPPNRLEFLDLGILLRYPVLSEIMVDTNARNHCGLHYCDRIRSRTNLVSGNKTGVLPSHINIGRRDSPILVQIAHSGDGGDDCDGRAIYSVRPRRCIQFRLIRVIIRCPLLEYSKPHAKK